MIRRTKKGKKINIKHPKSELNVLFVIFCWCSPLITNFIITIYNSHSWWLKMNEWIQKRVKSNLPIIKNTQTKFTIHVHDDYLSLRLSIYTTNVNYIVSPVIKAHISYGRQFNLWHFSIYCREFLTKIIIYCSHIVIRFKTWTHKRPKTTTMTAATTKKYIKTKGRNRQIFSLDFYFGFVQILFKANSFLFEGIFPQRTDFQPATPPRF